MKRSVLFRVLAVMLVFGCESTESPAVDRAAEEEPDEFRHLLESSLRAARAGSDSVVDALRPVPLMTTAQENELRRYDNDAHLARARALGVRPTDAAERDRLAQERRLVALSDSSERYAIELSREGALVVPATVALLEEVGRRFQAALSERGLPAYRIIISSALRSAEAQDSLRRANPNAAAGTSTHEYGTTVDVLYEAFAAPRTLPAAYAPAEPEWLHAHASTTARALLERAAARKSRELMAILGEVLREMQAQGAVYVTLERQQPVFHITVAR